MSLLSTDQRDYGLRKLKDDLHQVNRDIEKNFWKMEQLHQKWLDKMNLEEGVIEAIDKRISQMESLRDEALKIEVSEKSIAHMNEEISNWQKIRSHENASEMPITSYDLLKQRLKMMQLLDNKERLERMIGWVGG